MIISKKNIMLVTAVLGLILLLPYFFYKDRQDIRRTGYLLVEPGNSRLFIEDAGLTVNGWDSYGVTYFFIPSYARISSVSYERSETKIYDEDGALLEHPEFGSIQPVRVGTVYEESEPYSICFCQSDNLYTLNIDLPDTEAGEINRESLSPASVHCISPSGKETIPNTGSSIKARGNTTWENVEKKSYEIRFSEPVSLMNMTASKKWVLLANAKDKTRICNKMTFDISTSMEMEATTEADWADVYINGVYWGNYLICHEPGIGPGALDIEDLEDRNDPFFDPEKTFDDGMMKGYIYDRNPADISGGYLIEADLSAGRRKCGFYMPDGVFFHIKSPNNASREEISYISDYIKSIDSEIKESGSSDSIDYDSFAKRYIIEETLLNMDSQEASYYFYKKMDLDRLYAGPCWDYDQLYLISEEPDRLYDSILDFQFDTGDTPVLSWDNDLMVKNPGYKKHVAELFRKYAKDWDELLSYGIDSYLERIRQSLNMDYLRWENAEEGTYQFYKYPENDIRYLKYALYKRLTYLSELWETGTTFTEPDLADDSVHTVSFEAPDGNADTYMIKDGELIDEGIVPEYDEAVYSGWVNSDTGIAFSSFLPVYEDAAFFLKERK